VHRLGDTIVWVHPGSSEILFERSARNRSKGETVMHSLHPLHAGSMFGTAGKAALCVTGLAMLLMFPTGFWVWLRKRRAAQFEVTRRTRLRRATGHGNSEALG